METKLVAAGAGPESGIKGLGIVPGVLPFHMSVREERIEAGDLVVLVGRKSQRLGQIGCDALAGIEQGQLDGTRNLIRAGADLDDTPVVSDLGQNVSCEYRPRCLRR